MPTPGELKIEARRAERALEECYEACAPEWVRNPRAYVEGGACGVEADGHAARVKNLLVVVGSTLPEALLSITIHRPERVVLACGHSPDGQRWGRELREVVRSLPDSPAEVALVTFDDANPVHAFRQLGAAVQGEADDWVIDITGGRKSMSAAAFFLGVERGIRCVYLHGEHQRHLGRPLPGTLELRELPDPNEFLKLARRKQLKGWWESHQWASARGVLEELKDSKLLLDDLAREAHGRAFAYADAMVRWEGAEYGRAADVVRAAGHSLPAPADALGARWGALLDEAAGATPPVGIDRLLATRHPGLALAYIADAWRWAGRRGDVEPRLRYLRYFGLGDFAVELLFRAAKARCEFVTEGEKAKDARDEVKQLEKWLADDPKKLHYSYDKLARIVLTPLGEGAPGLPRLEGWNPPEVPPHWHASDEWRGRRDACAHHLAQVSEDDARTIGAACRDLVLAVAGRLHELDRTMPEREVVERWFEEPAFPPLTELLSP